MAKNFLEKCAKMAVLVLEFDNIRKYEE